MAGRFGKPDLIIPMPEEFTLEASGPDEYRYFEVDPGFSEDRWVQMAEARPGNRKIVHRIFAFVQAPGPPGPPSQYGRPQKKMTKEDFEMRAAQDKRSLLRREGFLMRLKPDVPVYDDGCGLPSGGSGTERDGSGESMSRAPLTGFAPGTSAWLWEPGIQLLMANILLLQAADCAPQRDQAPNHRLLRQLGEEQIKPRPHASSALRRADL